MLWRQVLQSQFFEEKKMIDKQYSYDGKEKSFVVETSSSVFFLNFFYLRHKGEKIGRKEKKSWMGGCVTP